MMSENKIKASELCRIFSVELDNGEELLYALRESGFSKIQAIKILVEEKNIHLTDAKVIVHNSSAWLDRKSADDKFHDSLEQSIEVIKILKQGKN